MTDITKQATDMFEQMKNIMPKLSVNKNGYEIRAQVLDMAYHHVWKDYSAKWGEYEVTAQKNSDGQISTTVKAPAIPGVKEVLEAADKFYDFVNINKSK